MKALAAERSWQRFHGRSCDGPENFGTQVGARDAGLAFPVRRIPWINYAITRFDQPYKGAGAAKPSR